MVVTLSTIGSGCGAPSAGYVARLYLLCAEEVMYITEPDENLQVKLWPVLSAALFELPLKPLTCTYSEAINESGGGASYKITLSTVYPAVNNGGIVTWAEEQRQKRFVAIFQTTTGEYFLAGDSEHGLRLSISRSATERHLVGVALQGLQPHRLYQLESADPAVLFAEVGFDEDEYLSTDYLT